MRFTLSRLHTGAILEPMWPSCLLLIVKNGHFSNPGPRTLGFSYSSRIRFTLALQNNMILRKLQPYHHHMCPSPYHLPIWYPILLFGTVNQDLLCRSSQGSAKGPPLLRNTQAAHGGLQVSNASIDVNGQAPASENSVSPKVF